MDRQMEPLSRGSSNIVSRHQSDMKQKQRLLREEDSRQSKESIQSPPTRRMVPGSQEQQRGQYIQTCMVQWAAGRDDQGSAETLDFILSKQSHGSREGWGVRHWPEDRSDLFYIFKGSQWLRWATSPAQSKSRRSETSYKERIKGSFICCLLFPFQLSGYSYFKKKVDTQYCWKCQALQHL